VKIKQNLPQIPAIIADKAISGDQDYSPSIGLTIAHILTYQRMGWPRKKKVGGGKNRGPEKVATAKVVAIEFA